jgi:hypothetical protein
LACTIRLFVDLDKEVWTIDVKLHKIEQIIDYYEPDIQDLDDNLVELDKFRNNIWFGKEK